jgi:hypothetical protein
LQFSCPFSYLFANFSNFLTKKINHLCKNLISFAALRSTSQHFAALRSTSQHFAALRSTSQHFAALRSTSLIIFFLLLLNFKSLSQTIRVDEWPENCTLDHASLTAKYHQYKERLYKHFMVMDRDPSGCIHNGIGQDPVDPCKFTVSAFSLPASSIHIAPSGAWGYGDRLEGEEFDGAFYDPNCGRTEANILANSDATSWETSATTGTQNYLDVGSETPTQLGWYWVMLSTEYELLGRNNQYKEQQKTLEDLFLSLQAYRRLDMKAQCIVSNMYNSRDDGEIICSSTYTNDVAHARNFDTDYTSDEDCNFLPDLSGYSGFAIREDATQVLEPILNDPTEDQYNIDMVSSAYAFSLSPPCTNDIDGAPVDQFCWLGRESSFLSQDQITGLLYGLRFIKKYIPQNATVTLCGNEGTFKVLEIAQKISNGLVSHVWSDPGLAITIPGTFNCTKKPIHLPESAGGQCIFTALGMLETNAEICGGNPSLNTASFSSFFSPSSSIANSAYNLLGASTLSINGSYTVNTNLLGTVIANAAGWPTEFVIKDPTGEGFWLQLKSSSRDLSNFKWRDRYVSAITHYDKEIYLLGNDLLYPAGTPISNEIDGKEYFKNMLCDAPCGGPCSKQKSYDPTLSGAPEFDCPNTPNWQGDRWDGLGADFDNSNDVVNKLSNGLDYMVLYNMYSLMYEQDEPFYNPQNVDRDGDFPSPDLYVGDEHILGPNNICASGAYVPYALTPNYSSTNASLVNIEWYSSPNISVVNSQTRLTNARLNQQANPSYIGVKFDENRLIPQYYEGLIVAAPIPYAIGAPRFEDVCNFDYRKSVVNKPEYMISTNFKLCAGDYYAKAEGLDDPTATYTWLIHDVSGNYYDIYGYGKKIDIHMGATNTQSYQVEVNLSVSDACGTKSYKTTLFGGCGWGLGNGNPTLSVSPNPAKDEISVGFSGESYQIPNHGVQIKFTNLSTGQQIKTEQIYANPSNILTTTFKQGSYQVQAKLSEGVYIETNLIISRE